MALLCVECEKDIGPSKQLPGREGTFVHPAVPALVWVPNQNEMVAIYVEAQRNFSLCFNCIDEKTTPERRSILDLVYQAVEAETTYANARRRQAMTGEISHDFIQKAKAIPLNDCLHCETSLPIAPKPFFTVRPLDRVKSGSYDTRFWGNSYSLEDLIEGSLEFPICSDCFAPNYPRLYSGLSSYLRNESSKIGFAERTYIQPSALAEAEQNPDFAEVIRKIAELDGSDPIILAEDPNNN